MTSAKKDFLFIIDQAKSTDQNPIIKNWNMAFLVENVLESVSKSL